MADHNNAKDAVTAWLNESEVFSLRIERLHEDAASGNDLVPWLVEAFRLGADRAAPEGQGYFGPMGIPHWSSALTPPPAAPTDNAALVEAALGMKRIVEEIDGVMKHGTWRDERGKRLKDTPEWVAFYNALASREPPPASQQEAEAESDLAAARAEIERLTKERDLSKELLRSCIQGNNVLRKKAQKAIAERDEARSMLADAERDMRQRAADACRISAQDQAEGGWRSEGMDMSRMLRSAILALPLKHADQGDKK